jgi:prepilin-type processing-associated H-X9-DG protein
MRKQEAFSRIDLVVSVGVVAVIGIFGFLCWPRQIGCKAKASTIQCVSHLKWIGRAFHEFAADNDGRFPFHVTNSVAFQDQTSAWIHFQAMSNQLIVPMILACPEEVAKGWRQPATNFVYGTNSNAGSLAVLRNEAVSYFVGINADLNMPQAILSGDRNMAKTSNSLPYSSRVFGGAVSVKIPSQWSRRTESRIHDHGGSFLFVDGSVNQSSDNVLINHLRLATNEYGMNINRFVFPQ